MWPVVPEKYVREDPPTTPVHACLANGHDSWVIVGY